MSTTTFPNINIYQGLYKDIDSFKNTVERYADSEYVNVEFEMRLGQYEGSSFVTGVSYEEFSRFYTYLEENCKKLESQNYLDIYSKYLNVGEDNFRISISGASNIMNYCSSNLVPLDKDFVTYQSKKKNVKWPNLDIDIYDVRLALTQEEKYTYSDIKKQLKYESLEDFQKFIYDLDKQFRYKKRISYVSKNGMFRYDLTQTKQVYDGHNNIRGDKYLGASHIFERSPIYEIEVELLNTPANYQKILSPELTDIIINQLTEITQIRQDNELVISNDHKEFVLKNMLSLYLNKANVDNEFNELYKRKDKQYSKIFPGAKVSTLEKGNIIPDTTRKEQKPYIYSDYTVTDKADGERFLLFIDSKGFTYLIDDRLNTLRTDIVVTGQSLESTLLDGELVITFDKDVKVYNYYAFDILFLNNKETYKQPLFPKTEKERLYSRYYNLETVVKALLKLEIPKINGVPIININIKNYKVINGTDPEKMKSNCDFIWTQREKIFKYDLDGLIFTPKYESYPIGKLWASALKWKPPSENSIDFLIKFVDEIKTVVQDDVITKYRLAHLYVGDSVERVRKGVTIRDYVEKKFDIPNTIGKDPTYLIKLPLDYQGNTKGSKDDMIIRSDTIVECVWNLTKQGWSVLRTRLDKTQRYLGSGKKISNTANNIAVAVSIWSTVVNPITTEMIVGQESTDKLIEDVEYYSKSGSELTEPMRGFNNYIKTVLINGARVNGEGLIDFSCGRGGDIKKWFNSNYKRVVGLDYSKTGVESLDPRIGAYGRLELYKKNNPAFTEWAENVKLFWADTSKITTAMYPNGICQKYQKLNAQKALEIPMDVGVSFFTAHYYFSNPLKIRGFFQNMYDNIKDNGLALVTCFDGLEIFKWLEHLETGQIYSGLVKSKTVWQIKKCYNKNTPFLDNSSNVGLKIDIKFESISEDYYSEYLVHPTHFIKLAEEYGFQVIPDSEAQSLFNLKKGTALFDDVIKQLQNPDEITKVKQSELGKTFYRDINNFVNDDDYADLREWNKHNRYFILRKHSNGDLPTPKGWRSRLSKYDCEREYTKEEDTAENVTVQTTETSSVDSSKDDTKPKKRTITKKIKTVVASPVKEEVTKDTEVSEESSVKAVTPKKEKTPVKEVTPKKETAKLEQSPVKETVIEKSSEDSSKLENSPVKDEPKVSALPKRRPLKRKEAAPKVVDPSLPESEPTKTEEVPKTEESSVSSLSESEPKKTEEAHKAEESSSLPESEPKVAPKKRVIKKVVTPKPEGELESEPKVEPPKRGRKKKEETPKTEGESSLAEGEPKAAPKPRVTKKKEETPKTEGDETLPEGEPKVEPPKRGRKKKEDVPKTEGESSLPESEPNAKPSKNSKKTEELVETPSELGELVSKAPIGTKVKVPAGLLKKK